jgi:hypothetical protein
MIVFILIYLASVIGAYLTIRKTFSKGGEWEVLNPGSTELFIMLMPGFNMFVCLVGIFQLIVDIVVDWIKSLNIKINYNRFFRIKK